MQIDPETGLPLMGLEDQRPIRLRIRSNGQRTVVQDAATGRVVDGVAAIQWQANPEGAQLLLVLGPAYYEMILDQEAVQGRLPAQIVDVKTERPVNLRPGEKLVVMESGRPRALLTVEPIEEPGPTEKGAGGGGE